MSNFHISDTNPNTGGGCVCGDTKQRDCDAPYAIFYATETDNNLSPHVVVCVRCADAFVEEVLVPTLRPEKIADAEVVEDEEKGDDAPVI